LNVSEEGLKFILGLLSEAHCIFIRRIVMRTQSFWMRGAFVLRVVVIVGTVAVMASGGTFCEPRKKEEQVIETSTEEKKKEKVKVILKDPSGNRYGPGDAVVDAIRIENKTSVDVNRFALRKQDMWTGKKYFVLELSPGTYKFEAVALSSKANQEEVNITEKDLQEHPEKRKQVTHRYVFSKRVTVKPGESSTVTMEGQESGYLKGNIVDSEGNPIRGLILTVPTAPPYDRSTDASFSFPPTLGVLGSTRKDGKFWMFNLPPSKPLTLEIWNRKMKKFQKSKPRGKPNVIKEMKIKPLKAGETRELGTIRVDM